MSQSACARFRAALQNHKPLQIVGTINAYCALMAERAGFQAFYLSGAGVANASFGLPDLGITNLNDVAEDARRITNATEVPLLVDIDTGFGGGFNIGRCIQTMQRSGVAAVHLEDQEGQKRCGHRPGKSVVPVQEMEDRLKFALDAREGDGLFIMARTDAAAVEGLDAALERTACYARTGVDGIFAEAVRNIEEYRLFVEASGGLPILANITEFGQTPLWTLKELAAAGVAMALYPLSAFRAMNRAAENLYRSLRQDGTQTAQLDRMQTRDELYDILGYMDWEQQLDRIQKR
ncbi:MAG: methylisocitrate lyase [Gammaproteobacteria bacterium]